MIPIEHPHNLDRVAARMERFQYCARILLICVLLALASAGLTAVQARTGFDPTADYLGPTDHLGGAANAVHLLPDVIPEYIHP